MKIKSIRLKNNYKRFRDLTIELGESPSKIIALIGPNGCGKSSVFDGMLYKLNVHDKIGQFNARDGKYHSMESGSVQHTDIIINFDTGDFNKVYQEKQKTGKHKTIFNFRNSYRYNSNLSITSLSAVPDISLNNYGATTSVDLDDKMVQNYQRLYVHITKTRKENNLTDKQAQGRVIGELNGILKRCLNLEIFDEGDIQAGRGTLYFKKDEQTKEFDFNVLSAGEKEVVDILLDLYLKKEEFSDTVYIIDEPELHLNTSIQKQLLIEIEKIIPDNCQLWLATHSIGFLNALQGELNSKCSVIHFQGDYSRQEIVLSPISKTRNEWKEIFKIALEDITGLIAPRMIIYCEGRKEPSGNGCEQGFDAKIYNSIFSQEFPEALFVSAGGSTEPDKYSEIALLIIGKAFEGVSILLLKDRDINSDGSSTTETQRLGWIGAEPSRRRMLKRREIENYLLDFEVLFKKYSSLTKADYDSIVSDVVNDDLKPAVGKFMQHLGIKSGMSKSEFLMNLSTVIDASTAVYSELRGSIFSLSETEQETN